VQHQARSNILRGRGRSIGLGVKCWRFYTKKCLENIYKCELEYNENLAEAVSRKCWIKKALMERKNLNALRFGHNFIRTWVMLRYHLKLSKSQF